MKFSKTLMVLVALTVMSVLNLRTYSQSSLSLGIEGGLNMSNINVTNVNTTNRTGFLIGGFADIGASRYVHIQPGLRYVSKGFSNTVNGITYTDRLSYIEIPALIKVTIPLHEVKPFFVAGPTLGIRLSASEEATDGVQVQTADAGNTYETIDFGLFFGAGTDFHVASNIDLFLSGGYSLGLSNVVKLTNISGTNSGIQFTSGVKFGL